MTDAIYIHCDNSELVYTGQQSIKCKSNSAVHKAALDDLDAQPQTKEELEKFKRAKLFANKA